jgi:Flp pilus assembly pilin Flp
MRISPFRAGLARRVRVFGRSESGAVMVEWVALAAALVIGSVAIAYMVMSGLATPARNIATQLSPAPAPAPAPAS